MYRRQASPEKLPDRAGAVGGRHRRPSPSKFEATGHGSSSKRRATVTNTNGMKSTQSRRPRKMRHQKSRVIGRALRLLHQGLRFHAQQGGSHIAFGH